jgi:hypothetical protein
MLLRRLLRKSEISNRKKLMLKDGKLMVGNIEILNLIFLKAKNVVILKID